MARISLASSAQASKASFSERTSVLSQSKRISLICGGGDIVSFFLRSLRCYIDPENALETKGKKLTGGILSASIDQEQQLLISGVV